MFWAFEGAFSTYSTVTADVLLENANRSPDLASPRWRVSQSSLLGFGSLWRGAPIRSELEVS